MEAEYLTASTATHQDLLKELGINIQYPIIIFANNEACVSFTDYPGNHRNSKHIDYSHYFMRERLQRGAIKLVYVGTLIQIADIFTKALEPEKFIPFRDALLVSRSLLKIIKEMKKTNKSMLLSIKFRKVLCVVIVCIGRTRSSCPIVVLYFIPFSGVD